VVDRRPSALVRSLAFVRKEIVEVVRQPRLILTLVLGPFLILLVFGMVYRATPAPMKMVVVVEENSAIAGRVEEIDEAFEGMTIESVTNDETMALRRLNNGDIDAVLVVPPDPAGDVLENRQSTMTLYHDRLDPFQVTYISVIAGAAVDEVNRRVLEEVAARAQETTQAATQSDLAKRLQEELGTIDPQVEQLQQISPKVLISPFTYESKPVFDFDLPLAGFYAPGVMVVLLQHVAVTFGALSLVRERSLGTSELFKVSPLTGAQTLIGKYLAYLIFGGFLAAALSAGIFFLLGLPPPVGGWWVLVSILILLILASTGLGLAVSALARTESQAVQYTMTTLLVTMFFSGFVLPLDQLADGAQAISFAIPTTYGIIALHDNLFRGVIPWSMLGGLAAYAALMFTLAWLFLHRAVEGEREPTRVMLVRQAAG
jgi:ABC-2 type transport system permease protein